MCNYTTTSGHGYEILNGTTEILINFPVQDDFLIINSIIENISPYTTYTCWAYIISEIKLSKLSESINVTTLEDSK